MRINQVRTALMSMAGLVFVQCGWGGGSSPSLPETLSLQASAAGPSQVELSWTVPSGGATGYRVLRDGERITDTLLTGTALTDFNRDADSRYCYRIIAVQFPLGDVARSNEACLTTGALAGWPLDTVAETSMEGSYASLVVDDSGFAHVGFRGSLGVAYANNASGSGWEVLPVDTAAGPRGDVAIDRDGLGRVHLSYYDVDRDRLMYALRSGTTWSRRVVIVGGGAVNALSVDAAGQFVILYAGADATELSFVTGSSGIPGTPQLIASYSDAVQRIAIARDTSGLIHAALAVGSGTCAIRYLVQTGPASWDDTVIESGQAACGVDLALAADNTPYLVYMRGTELRVASPGSTPQIVDAMTYVGGADVGIAVDAAGALHVSYQDINADLKYAESSGGPWQRLTIDADGVTGGHNQLRVDDVGTVHIVYDHFDTAMLGYAQSP